MQNPMANFLGVAEMVGGVGVLGRLMWWGSIR